MGNTDSFRPRSAPAHERALLACAALLAHAGVPGWARAAARTVHASIPGCVGAGVGAHEPPGAPDGATVGLSVLAPMPEYLARVVQGRGEGVGPRGHWISDSTWSSSGYATARAAAGLGEFARAAFVVEGGLSVVVHHHAGLGADGGRPAREASEVLAALRPLLLASVRESVVAPRLRRAALMERVPRAAREAVTLLVSGKTEGEIGALLHKSPHTVHDYVKSVYDALGVRTRYELLRLWLGVE
jgi:DNA-binding CsgD family transcriptional regulator